MSWAFGVSNCVLARWRRLARRSRCTDHVRRSSSSTHYPLPGGGKGSLTSRAVPSRCGGTAHWWRWTARASPSGGHRGRVWGSGSGGSSSITSWRITTATTTERVGESRRGHAKRPWRTCMRIACSAHSCGRLGRARRSGRAVGQGEEADEALGGTVTRLARMASAKAPPRTRAAYVRAWGGSVSTSRRRGRTSTNSRPYLTDASLSGGRWRGRTMRDGKRMQRARPVQVAASPLISSVRRTVGSSLRTQRTDRP